MCEGIPYTATFLMIHFTKILYSNRKTAPQSNKLLISQITQLARKHANVQVCPK